MGKQRHKMIVAGPLVYEAVYPMPKPRDPEAVRRGKAKLTSSAQELVNLKNQWQKLECLMAANFRRGDLVVALTFRNETLPKSRSEALQRIKKFFYNLRVLRGLRGQEVIYLYNLEHKHLREKPSHTAIEKAMQGRWHVHLLINSTGDDYDDLNSSWGLGLIDVEPFRVDREKNYETLARYWCKELVDKPGQRRYSGSRGLKRPEVDCRIIDSLDKIAPPKGCDVYANTGEVPTLYGKYQVIKYVWPEMVPDAPKTKKRKKRQTG